MPRIIDVAQPAAGADWSTVVPGGVMWHLESVAALFTSSAVAGNRSIRLRANGDGRVLASLGATGVIAASLTHTISWVRGAGYSTNLGGPGGQTMGLWEMLLQPAWTVGPSTLAGDVGDQWTAIELYVIEYRPPVYITPDAIPDYS